MVLRDFRQFSGQEIWIGKTMTAIAGINGSGKSTVLGLLANSSELKNQKRYDGRRFRSEFSELFKASLEHDPKGSDRVSLHLDTDDGPLDVVFRTTWQGGNTRFRVIPRWIRDGRKTESKIPMPSVYLGLSRLYPVGEAPDGSLASSSLTWDSDDDKQWFLESYLRILSLRDHVVSVDSVSIDNIDAKRGVGVDTENYSAYSNSSGQDNLGQILLAILSFRKLKRDLEDGFPGGLLVIDELDASLHPAAQLRLVDLLSKESKSLGIQTVFTTHSTVILKHLCGKTLHNPADRPGDIEISYITDANRRLVVKRNPGWLSMEDDLFIGSGASDLAVRVLTEDDQARWVVNSLIKAVAPDLIPRIRMVEASLGCKQLAKLYAHDYDYISHRIVVFDGDVNFDEFPHDVPADRMREDDRIVCLPGGCRPEKLVYDYLIDSQLDSPIWEALDRNNLLTHRALIDNGPASPKYSAESTERNKHKRWFEDNRWVFDTVDVMRYWAEDNGQQADEFAKAIRKAWEAVARWSM